jgi:glycosyltransferase involved in cell wall biosynthesis
MVDPNIVKISVVIPSYEGGDRIGRALHALCSQTIPAGDFEVIVIVDGEDEASMRVAQNVPAPFHLRVFSQPHSGAGAARNAGLLAARADLVLFIDDDMVAAPHLLEGHLSAHARKPGHVALGYFDQTSGRKSDDILECHAAIWWQNHFAELGRPCHRYSFRDLCAGNFSIAKKDFNKVGGFSNGFLHVAGEDYELGIRLIKQGIPFHFVPKARTTHHFQPSRKKAMHRAYQEGRGDLRLAKMHPDLAPSLALVKAVEDGPWIWLGRWVRLSPTIMMALPFFLSAIHEVANVTKSRALWKMIYDLLHSCFYWRGVFDEAGSQENLRFFAQDMILKAESYVELFMDLEKGVHQIEEMLATVKADAINIVYRDTVIGRIAPRPGYEALRAIHVHQALIESFALRLLRARVRQQVIYDTERRVNRNVFSSQ